MPHILVVSASDTGRGPMTKELLRMLLKGRGADAQVSSAGVLGHDGDPLQQHALLALESLGCRAQSHTARSVSEQLIEQADLLLAIDRSTARVLVARFSAASDRLAVLPVLANDTDVPDPFHMTLDAWVIYGRQLLDQLRTALPELMSRTGISEAQVIEMPAQIVDLRAVPEPPQPAIAAASAAASPPAPQQPSAQDAGKLPSILAALRDVPEIVDWERARTELVAALAVASQGCTPGDMAPALLALLSGLVAQLSGPPTAGQLQLLSEAVALLSGVVDAAALAQVASAAASWPSL